MAEDDIATANLKAALANFGANMLILSQIEIQISLQRQLMADNAKFHRELLQSLDRIIRNQNREDHNA